MFAKTTRSCVLAGAALAIALASTVPALAEDVATSPPEAGLSVALPGFAVAPAIDERAVEAVIERYLMENPGLVVRMIENAQRFRFEEQARLQREALADYEDLILALPGLVKGNPDGDVTLVEFVDYNCGFCRQAVADVKTMIETDENLRVLVIDMPVLGAGSFDAAMVGMSVRARLGNEAGIAFHDALFARQGQIGRAQAIEEAVALGADPDTLEADLQDGEMIETIYNAVEIAQAVGITGTPSWVVGGEIIVGAVGATRLLEAVDNTRTCGRAAC